MNIIASIEDPLEYLEANTDALDAAQKKRDLGQSLTDVLERCEEIESQLPRLSSSIQLIGTLPRYQSGKVPRIERVADDLDSLGIDLQKAKDPDSLDKVARDAQDFKRWANSLNLVAIEMVDEFKFAEVDKLRTLRALLNELGRDELVSEIEAIQSVTREAIDRKTKELPEQIVDIQGRLKKLASKITELAGDPEIDAFLKYYARNGEAPLSLVTANVVRWLGDRNILDSFRVLPN